MKDFSIILPVDKNNNPDWDYMDNYIKKTMLEYKEKLKNIQ